MRTSNLISRGKKWLALFGGASLVLSFGLFASTAFAGVGLGVSPNFPSTVAVGDTAVPVSLDITNSSTGGDGNPVNLTSISLIPSCGANSGTSCTSPDLGVFTVSATGTGAGSCAGTNFTITVTDATTGKVTFTPSGTVTLALGQTCHIDFTVNVVGAPDVDASGTAGLQTIQVAEANAVEVGQQGLTGGGFGTDTTTVTKASPNISTTPSPTSGSIGDVLNDTASLTGGSSPTGNVTFKLFPPSDATCEGSPVFTQVDGAAPYTTGPGYTSLVAGTYRWTADYAGDSSNNPASSGCQAEQVVIGKASPTISTTPSAGGEVGVVLNDTATLSGGSSPTGTVTFKLYPPADSTCSGTPVFTQADATSPYGTTTGYTSLVAGTYRWTADYAGDTNNNAVSSGCQEEQVVITEPSGEWCSPGYWKNHLDEAAIAAAAGGFSLSDTYASQFTSAPPRKPKGVKENAPTNPTLLQVLQHPEWYGGDAFNKVADLLSEAHPDVDFTMGDQRIENCPLS